jgi:hypothetical protein
MVAMTTRWLCLKDEITIVTVAAHTTAVNVYNIADQSTVLIDEQNFDSARLLLVWGIPSYWCRFKKLSNWTEYPAVGVETSALAMALALCCTIKEIIDTDIEPDIGAFINKSSTCCFLANAHHLSNRGGRANTRFQSKQDPFF